MVKKILMAAVGIALAGTALAQTTLTRAQEGEAIEAITAVGGACERVVRTQTVGELDDRSSLMAVACEGGEDAQYVVQLDRRGNMTFYATCANLAEGTNNQIRCFASNQRR